LRFVQYYSTIASQQRARNEERIVQYTDMSSRRRGSYVRRKLKTLVPPHLLVRAVAEGQNPLTMGIACLNWGPTADEVEIAYQQSVIDAGLVATVLQLLERCDDETFVEVLSRYCGGGDLEAPATWLLLLRQAATTDDRNGNNAPVHLNSRMDIARRIGPVVRCMTNDSQRTFFGENKYWWKDGAIVHFVVLLKNLVRTPETIPILFQYDGLTKFLIQCLFWGSHRADIVEESHKHYADKLEAKPFETIRQGAIGALRALFCVEEIGVDGSCFTQFTDIGTQRLKTIASTKIVSDKYNPDCKVTFAAGWFDLMNEGPSEDERNCLWCMLRQLIWAHCVDRAMIVRMVQYAMTTAKSSSDAREIVTSLYIALRPDGRPLGLNVDRYSVAIKAGLIEMCLTVIIRLGNVIGSDRHCDTILKTLGAVLTGVSAILLYSKTAKALCERRSHIQEALRSADGISEEKSFELVKKVQYIVSINMETGSMPDEDGLEQVLCRRCDKGLQANQIKMCSKCHQGTTCFCLN
jgi:hypothetical protein